MCENCKQISEKKEWIYGRLHVIQVFSLMPAGWEGPIFKSKGWPHPYSFPATDRQISFIQKLYHKLVIQKKATFEPDYNQIIQNVGDSKEAASQLIEELCYATRTPTPDFYFVGPKGKNYSEGAFVCMYIGGGALRKEN